MVTIFLDSFFDLLEYFYLPIEVILLYLWHFNLNVSAEHFKKCFEIDHAQLFFIDVVEEFFFYWRSQWDKFINSLTPFIKIDKPIFILIH